MTEEVDVQHQKLANEYAEKIKRLAKDYERQLEALYREYQAKANAESLTRSGAGSSPNTQTIED